MQPYYRLLEPVFGRVEAGQSTAVFSVVTEAEALVKPIREGRSDIIARIETLLRHRHASVIPVNRIIARRAAHIRARTGLALTDTIIVATAVEAGCQALVGNDARWARRVSEIRYVHLDDITGT